MHSTPHLTSFLLSTHFSPHLSRIIPYNLYTSPEGSRSASGSERVQVPPDGKGINRRNKNERYRNTLVLFNWCCYFWFFIYFIFYRTLCHLTLFHLIASHLIRRNLIRLMSPDRISPHPLSSHSCHLITCRHPSCRGRARGDRFRICAVNCTSSFAAGECTVASSPPTLARTSCKVSEPTS